MAPEYLELFSNTGIVSIRVRFKDSDSFISEQKLDAAEIRNLITADGKSFITRMRFDDHLAEVEKVDILVSKNRIILHARLVATSF